MRLPDLLDISVLRTLAAANFKASGMPIGIIDAVDGAALVAFGWQDVCTMYHRVNAVSAERCRESDDYIRRHVCETGPCEYKCKNGLRDIGVPIAVEGEHVATLFLGQFFYEGESPDRDFFTRQAQELGFDNSAYLRALDRVPVFSRTSVENILAYNTALARVISDLAESALRRRRAEAQAESLARFPQENPDPVLRVGSDFTVVYANDAARSGLRDLGIEPGIAAPTLMCDLARRALAERQRIQAEVSSSGRVFAMDLFAVGDEVNVYAHDITARKRIEEELREANRRKDDFLGMLSHELRNPLGPIRNSLHILDHVEPAGQQARRAREVAGRQLSHLTRLVDDLLDVTRIARGKVDLRLTHLELCGLARRTGEDYQVLMRERGIDFVVETPEQQTWVNGDETRLAQIIGNLLQNAAKFTPDKGRVSLSVVREGDAAAVRVRDTGLGIEPDLLAHVFEPFVQAKQSLARTEGGLGLGLAIVKALVELHGGTIAVTSGGRGLGAELTVRLPLLTSVQAAADDVLAVRAMSRNSSRRVLVVDDNHDAAESLAECVKMLGHGAEVAFDGLAAVERAGANVPDVVLCDIELHGMSGYEVARALRSDPRCVGVHLIAVSGYAGPDDRQRAFDAGFDDHMLKPFDLTKLESLLLQGKAADPE